MERLLLVINGHSGAGKSTLAAALGHWCTAREIPSAVIDFDSVVQMVGTPNVWTSHHVWVCARRAVAGLVDGFFAHGCDVVVIEGDFWIRYGGKRPEWPVYDAGEDFVSHLTCDVDPVWVGLRVSFDEALRRVRNDEARRADSVSRDAEWLRRGHEGFEARLMELGASHVVLESDHRSPAELVDDLTRHLVRDGLLQAHRR